MCQTIKVICSGRSAARNILIAWEDFTGVGSALVGMAVVLFLPEVLRVGVVAAF